MNDTTESVQQSRLAEAVAELRAAMNAQWSEPLPCSGNQAMNRACRVIFARRDFDSAFNLDGRSALVNHHARASIPA